MTVAVITAVGVFLGVSVQQVGTQHASDQQGENRPPAGSRIQKEGHQTVLTTHDPGPGVTNGRLDPTSKEVYSHYVTLQKLEQDSFLAMETDIQTQADWPRQRKQQAAQWLMIIPRLRAAVDPEWDTPPRIYANIGMVEYEPGPKPGSIHVSADYQKRFDENDRNMKRYNQQDAVRDVLSRFGSVAEKVLVRMYVRAPLNQDELQRLRNRSRAGIGLFMLREI